MEQIHMPEIERKIIYWSHVLSKMEEDMLRMQSERVEVKRRLAHLQLLQEESGLKKTSWMREETGVKETSRILSEF